MCFQGPRNRLAIVLIPLALVIVGCSGTGTGGDDVDITDGSAPWIITDLSVADFTSSTVTLTWTATGDDSTSGTASRYDIRRSASVIGFVEFDSAVQIPNPPTPKPAGETETWTVTGLSTDSTYYFAIKAYDEEDNWQGVSNCVSATCINDYTVAFPDDGLEAAVRAALSKPTGDVMKSELLTLFNLSAGNRSIADLTGLQHCVALQTLDLYSNSIGSISLLAGLTGLSELYLGHNQIDDIAPLGTLTDLRVLMMHNNDIADISVLSDLEELHILGMHNNMISNLGPLVANSGLTAGDSVYLDGNPLSYESINIHLPALLARNVTVYWTEDTIPPNRVVDFAADSVGADLVRLRWTAPVGDPYTGFAYQYDLRYSTDSATLVNWTGATPALSVPDPAAANTPQTATVTGLETDSTYFFAIRSADKSMNWSESSNIVKASTYLDEPVTITDANLDAALRDALSKPSGDLYRSDLLSLTSLTAQARSIDDLTGLEYCTNLLTLDLTDNSISNIEAIQGLTSLTQLELQDNDIIDISPLGSLNHLGVLQLSNNPIVDLSPISGLSGLWYLAVINVATSDMGALSGLTNLQYLFIVANGVTDISFVAGCSTLNVLYATNNAISSLTPLTNLEHLGTLKLEYNQIVDIQPLVSNPNIGSGDVLDLSGNPLSVQSINTHIPALQARGVTVTY